VSYPVLRSAEKSRLLWLFEARRSGRLRVWRRRSDRGATSIIVAMVLGFGVLLGSATFVVDVGQLYFEREVLQSGADSAAIGVARNCAANPAACASQATTAKNLANSNAADDGRSGVTTICGTGQGLPACPAQMAGVGACLGTPPNGTPYVEVRTQTELANGSTLLPPTFAQTMISGYQGRAVHACARAAWTAAESAVTKAVMFSTCEWAYATNNGKNLRPTPAEQAPDKSWESVFHAHAGATGAADGCTGHGPNTPGGYGWLPHTASKCHTNVKVGDTYTEKDTASAEADCTGGLSASVDKKLVLVVAIYDTVTTTGGTVTYHVVGLTGFVVTGFHFANTDKPSSIPGGGCGAHDNSCTGSERCIYGYFTHTVVTGGDGTYKGMNYGASVITGLG